MQKTKDNRKRSGKQAKAVFRSVRHVVWLAVNLLAICCLLLADCSVWVDPSKAFVPAAMGIGFRPLLWLNILFALSWLFSRSRKRWSLLGLAAVLLSAGSIGVTYSHGTPAKGETAHSLKILSYNTHELQKNRKAKENDVLRYIRESGADIVFLQEYEVVKNAHYLTFNEAKQFLLQEYPYTYYDFSVHNARRQYGLAIYSKYPLIHKHSISYKGSANLSDYCDAVVAGDTVRLLNNHLESIGLTTHDLNWQDGEAVSRSAEGVKDKMHNAYERRVEEVKMVRDVIRESPYPLIVAGDMNDVPVSYTYHNISRGLQDCFLQSSWLRTGSTYMRRHMGIRIDHIFVSKTMRVRSFETGRVDYSDHHPVVAEIGW